MTMPFMELRDNPCPSSIFFILSIACTSLTRVPLLLFFFFITIVGQASDLGIFLSSFRHYFKQRKYFPTISLFLSSIDVPFLILKPASRG